MGDPTFEAVHVRLGDVHQCRHRLPGGVFTFVLLLIPPSPACQVPGQLADLLYVGDLSLSGSCPLGSCSGIHPTLLQLPTPISYFHVSPVYEFFLPKEGSVPVTWQCCPWRANPSCRASDGGVNDGTPKNVHILILGKRELWEPGRWLTWQSVYPPTSMRIRVRSTAFT